MFFRLQFGCLISASIGIGLLLCATGQAVACACCTNTGQRNVGVSKIDSYAAGILQEVRFASDAELYVGEADMGDVKGIKATSSAWRLAVSKTGQAWRFVFDDRKGSTGTLTLMLPTSVTKFEVDPRDPDRMQRPNGPILYKEWRLTTNAVGGGMLAGSAGDGQQATLILHGRGNSCTDASQFSAWTLVLHGPKGTNSIFGKMLPQ